MVRLSKVFKIREWKDELHGGKADKMKPSDFDPKELAIGSKEEMEHTDDPHKAMEIAMDQLVDDPHYYTKMKKGQKNEAFPPGSSKDATKLDPESEKVVHQYAVELNKAMGGTDLDFCLDILRQFARDLQG